LSTLIIKCKFSLLAPSLRQQRAKVLFLHRVIQTRFLTNQRACFFRTVLLFSNSTALIKLLISGVADVRSEARHIGLLAGEK